MLQNKKAAMFGLDARIALTIFAALSVITGAALYKAVQHAKVVAIHQEFVEIEKAIESYMLDTGQNMPVTTDPALVNTHLDVDELFESSIIGWKGPYLELKKDLSDPDDSMRTWHDKATYRSLFITYRKANKMNCDGTDPCFYWIDINHISVDMAKKLDIYVDSINDEVSGKIRYYFFSDPPLAHVSYRSTTPLMNQK